MQLSPFSCHLIHLWSKYPPQDSVLKHPQSITSTWILFQYFIFSHKDVVFR
jgi:hypothetical protein